MVYLRELQAGLYASASSREKLLYDYLKGQSSSLDPTRLKLEEKFCHDALFLKSGLEELSKIRAVKPFKGLHYTNNLTLLIAAALLDPDGEKHNLENYIKTCTASEQFIINTVLDKDDFFTSNISTPIDSLAIKLINQEFVEETDLLNCMDKIKNLFDYFVFESGVCRKAYQIESEKKINEYKAFVSFTSSAVARVKFSIKTILIIILLIVSYFIIPLITNLTVEYWDKLEPLVWLLNLGLSFVFLLMGVVLMEIVDKTKEKINQGF